MKLERWALIAEIIGAAAIVCSLIFVGLEIRRNTNASYAATYGDLLSEQIDWRMDLVMRPELMEDWLESVGNPNAVPPEMWVSQAQGFIAEKAYIAWTYGILDDEGWARYARTACVPYMKEMLALPQAAVFYTDDFVNFVRDCESRE